MARPGVVVTLRETPSTPTFPTDTGVWFVTGLTEKGPTASTQVLNLNQYVEIYGQRVSYGQLYDAMEVFFREGGGRAYIARVVGPAATSGFKNLNDNAAAVSLVATAIGPGDWSQFVKVGVIAGGVAGTFKIQVTDASNVVLEQSEDLANQQSAVNWSQYSKYIRITLGASALNPVPVAPAVLSTGTDDRAAITDAQWQTALDAHHSGLGPGQVSAPGRTSDTAHNQLASHAANSNRCAVMDSPNTPTVATLLSSGGAISNRFSAHFAPWLIVPGLTSGTFRTVPPSALVAGLCAKNDASFGAGAPSAGNRGISVFASDLSQPAWTDTDRETLNDGRINVIRRMFDSIRVYGWRASVSKTSDPNWAAFNSARMIMEMTAEFYEAAEEFMFMPIDGQNGDTIGAFRGSLVGVCARHYEQGNLFGDTPEEAYNVDTGPGVNTLETIANLELHAVVSVKIAPMTEWIKIEIVKRLVTEAVA